MNGTELQTIAVRNENGEALQIAYRYRKPVVGKPVFVWLCGFMSNMDGAKAEALTEWASSHGAGSLRFDYSGHGRSGGRFEDGTISLWLSQAEAVLGLIPRDIGIVLVGSSMGGWISLLLAQKYARENAKAPRGIALIAPAWDMTRMMLERASPEARASLDRTGVYHRPSAYSDTPYPITKALIDDGERHLFGDAKVAVNCPVRVIQGCRDEDVPAEHSINLIERLAAEDVTVTLIKDAEHRLSRPQDLAVLFSLLAPFL